MWLDEDLHEPNDEDLPEKYETERQFERKQAKLAKFLRNRKPGVPEPEIPTDEDMAAWHMARVMLSASELLEACKYNATLLGGLSTEQFAAGGDRPAREKLLEAIVKATDGAFNSQALMERCAEDVRRAILVNQSRV
jgi:hypothetical protein